MHLDEHAPTGSRGLVRQGKERTPEVWRLAAAEHAKRDGHARLYGQRLQASEILVDPFGIEPDIFVGDFKHARVHFPQNPDQLADLVPGRETARDRLSIRGL